MKFGRKLGLSSVVLIGGVYYVDETCWYSVIKRSIRAFGIAGYTIFNYKFLWNIENSHQVNFRVANAITKCCLENEGLYVKIGQAICSMSAILPPEYSSSLSQLLDNAKTYEYEVIEKIIDSEIGKGVLRDIEKVPVGSASLAQVHRGIYVATGEPVAIKVQKPNVSVQARFDLAMYRFMLRMLEWTFDIPLSWSVGFTCSHFMAELDFRLEGENSEITRKQLNGKFGNSVYVPKVLHATKKVLISEWAADTVMISNVAGLKKKEFNCKSVIQDATRVFGYQIFNTGHVHCDPHPGNLLIRQHPTAPTGTHQIVLIDHGLYVDLPDRLRTEYGKLWLAMTPPTDQAEIERICTSWGIGSFELFQTIVRSASRRTDPQIIIAETKTKKSPKENAAIVKEHLKKLLQDTSKFPKELILVGRCMNYIRAANWTHGAPIDRVAVLAECAREAAELGNRSGKNWIISLGSKVMGYLPGGSSYSKPLD